MAGVEDESLRAALVEFNSPKGRSYLGLYVPKHRRGPCFFLSSPDKAGADFVEVKRVVTEKLKGKPGSEIMDRGSEIYAVIKLINTLTGEEIAEVVKGLESVFSNVVLTLTFEK